MELGYLGPSASGIFGVYFSAHNLITPISNRKAAAVPNIERGVVGQQQHGRSPGQIGHDTALRCTDIRYHSLVAAGTSCDRELRVCWTHA